MSNDKHFPIRANDSFLALLRREVRESIGAGAALAALTLVPGCGDSAEAPADAAGGGIGGAALSNTETLATGETGGGGAGGAPNAASPTVPASSLEPYPLDRVTCVDTPEGPPYRGPQCCFQTRCYTPPDGMSCATDLDSPEVRSIPRAGPFISPLEPGGGTCGCSVEGHPAIEGPFAANDAADAGATGACCYVVGTTYCLGRPFVVNGLGYVASAQYRGDWGLFA
jgi:hypothetical protein